MKLEQHMCVLRATPCFVPAAPVNEAKTTDVMTRVPRVLRTGFGTAEAAFSSEDVFKPAAPVSAVGRCLSPAAPAFQSDSGERRHRDDP